ncbi:rhamnogalacturonan lyase [Paenibacillus shenyangensis]|uniref:rhamnogalacturonan lyase n=1 Tax=Paenibacillus sp. A9 TaxID=1284352 RepID=UPI000381CD56|nr:rhamnogalacturonan lyase [Paenibacillus sp. A9]
MRERQHSWAVKTLAVALGIALVLPTGGLSAADPVSVQSSSHSQRGVQLESLDRGLVAAKTGDGIFISWRLLGNEVSGYSKTGLTGTDFALYRNGKFVTVIKDSTNYLDRQGSVKDSYRVLPLSARGSGSNNSSASLTTDATADQVSDDVYQQEAMQQASAGQGGDAATYRAQTDEGSAQLKQYAADYGISAASLSRPNKQKWSPPATVWNDTYYDLPLQKPADGVTPAGEAYTYSANDMSVGDVDGDGEYEYFVKWYPSNAKDVSQKGYTGNTYIDAYRLDGTLLYRIDLGVNIRSGAHYTQFLVYDFDGNGKAELMMKTAPGTKITRYGKRGNVVSEQYISLPKEDRQAGYSNSDDYRMSSTDYYDHVVQMFQNWSEHPEVKNGHWPKTLEECFGIAPKYQYPLSLQDAKALTDYFMDVYAPARSTRNNLRDFEGFIVKGPEYMTVFKGRSGKEEDTVRYEPERTDDGLMWGDYAMARIEPGNRVDRFLATVAYVNGKTPSAVFARGYYTRAALVSYNWDGKKIGKDWTADSGWAIMSNPFNDGPHGRDGTDPDLGPLAGQGAHSLTAADVDGDGKDEIVYGSGTVDNDGSLLYSSTDVMPAGSAIPGQIAKLGHGDALHVSDLDPSHPGMEIYMVHEGGTYAPYGYAMRDAATGKVLFGAYSGKDTGRGMVGDIDPTRPGLEAWATDLRTASGELIGRSAPGTNMNIKWSADMTTQVVDGALEVTPSIQNWQKGPVLVANGTLTNNGTKGNPSLVADIFGDWREELLLRTADSSAIRIYLSTEVTNHKLYTLMHDTQYRTGIARQNTAYNQPSYTSFYLASDTDWSRVPKPDFYTPGRK